MGKNERIIFEVKKPLLVHKVKVLIELIDIIEKFSGTQKERRTLIETLGVLSTEISVDLTCFSGDLKETFSEEFIKEESEGIPDDFEDTAGFFLPSLDEE